MANSNLLDDLVLHWEDKRAAGVALTPEQACRDHPELLADFQARLQALESIDKMLDETPTADPAATASGIGPPTILDPDLSFLRPCPVPGAIGQLGPFRVLAKIGEGGMGWVFVAEDPVVLRRVALKVMRPGLAADSQARARFLREAQSAAALNHDHIIEVYQVGEDNGVTYIAMPLLKGRSLESRLHDTDPAPVDLIVQVGRETALGLAAAHQQGLLHRDIKPANLWLEERTPSAPGQPPSIRLKILDFGLAVLQGQGDTRLTQAGALLGTPGYMSPEQVDGGSVDGRSDLFALGCVLYRMAARQLPFRRANLTATLRATVEEEPPAPEQFNPEIPPPLAQLIKRLMAKKPGDRPTTAHEAAAEFTRLQKTPASAVDTVSYRDKAPPRRGRHSVRWIMAASAAAASVLIAVFLWQWLPLPPNPAPAPNPGPAPNAAAAPLRAELDVRVWKKNDLKHMRALADIGVLPLEAGDYLQIVAQAHRPVYFYLVQLESAGTIAPMYPWQNYEWDRRGPEQPRAELRWPDDPLNNSAPLSPSPSGIEAIFLLARATPLSAEEQAQLPGLFAGFPVGGKAEVPRGVIWLSDRDPPRTSHDADRGRLDLAQAKRLEDPVERVRTLLRVDLPKLFAESRAVCYAFQGP